MNDRDPSGTVGFFPHRGKKRDKEGGRFEALGGVDSPEQHGVWIRGEGARGSGSERRSVSCDVR